MDAVNNQTYTHERVTVDGKAFTDCTFTSVTLVYVAGTVPTFTDCSFDNTSLVFEGAASSTLQFLSGLYQGGFARSVDAIFENIRKGEA